MATFLISKFLGVTTRSQPKNLASWGLAVRKGRDFFSRHLSSLRKLGLVFMFACIKPIGVSAGLIHGKHCGDDHRLFLKIILKVCCLVSAFRHHVPFYLGLAKLKVGALCSRSGLLLLPSETEVSQNHWAAAHRVGPLS